MSRIDELLKNEKVEWKKLGEVCEIVRGVRVTKKELVDNGEYPVVSGGIGYMGYLNNYNRKEDTITIAQYGTAGYVCWQKEKFWANDVCFSVYPNEKVIKKFLYHFLLQKQQYLYSISNKSAVPYSISKEKILKIEIPVPSIETQEKIVKILDKFTNHVTELQAELQTELQARNKQYEYYRDLLLSEKYLTKLSKEFYQLEELKTFDFVKISELCLRQRGIKITAEQMKSLDKEDSSVKVFAGGNTTANLSPEEVGIENIINKPSVIVKSRGNIDFVYYDGDFTHKNEMWSYSSLDKEKLNIKFLYYILKNNLKYFKDNAISGKLPQISTGITDNYKIPLPSIYIQNKVVEVLDKFQDLLSDTQGLLPDEIEQRQKQYEYYREKLLTFEYKSDSTPQNNS